MAGFYVNNNVGIALRCFATGLFFGVGSAFYLVENGLATGAIMGYVASHGAGDNILTFVVGHGSLELGAIVLAGGAGHGARLVDRRARGQDAHRVAPGDGAERRHHRLRRGRHALHGRRGRGVLVVVVAARRSSSAAWARPCSSLVMAYIVLAGRGSSEAAEVERAEGIDRWT